jgi:hypothetical protein
MIVGHKTVTYLTTRWQWSNMFNRRIVTKHTVVSELHATKGWRTVHRHRQSQIRAKRLHSREWRLNHTTTFEHRRTKKAGFRLQVRP